MIEVHFHCLPGIDDGPPDWEEAIALCRIAAEEGTSTIVATPHVLRESWVNEDPGVRDDLVSRLNAALGGRPTVLPGCEYWFSADAVEQVERGRWGPLTALNRGRYLLIEFPPGPPPAEAESVFFELSLKGVTPVLAHPERNPLIARAPDLLGVLAARGALVQLTAGSLLGDFGKAARDACHELLDRGLVHLVSSDAHSTARRPPRLAAARRSVERGWGSDLAQTLFEENPAAVIESRPLPGAGRGTGPQGART